MSTNRAMRLIERFCADRRGVAAVEFILVMPFVIYLAVGAIDYGMLTYRTMQVHDAAQAGMQYAAVAQTTNTQAIASVVTNATTYSSVAASPAPATFYGCASSGTIQIASQGSICSDGSAAGEYLNVYASATYNTILTYPAIPATFALSGQATVRLN